MNKTMSEKFNDILSRVRAAANKRILFLPHALSQMNAPERMITPQEIRAVIFSMLYVLPNQITWQ